LLAFLAPAFFVDPTRELMVIFMNQHDPYQNLSLLRTILNMAVQAVVDGE